MANRLDAMGLKVESDAVDGLIKKIAMDHDDESEDPGEWSESKWDDWDSKWDSKADTFGNNKYTVVKLYMGDGKTPVLGDEKTPVLWEAKHEIEWVKRPVIVPVKGDIGTTFDLEGRTYKIVELGTEDSPGKAVRVNFFAPR